MDSASIGGSGRPTDVKQSFGNASGGTGGSRDPSVQPRAQAIAKQPRQKSRRRNNAEDAEAEDAAKRRCMSMQIHNREDKTTY